VQRQTLKTVPVATAGGGQEVWMYGCSWWGLDELQQHVPNPSVPLGANFANAQLELQREFHAVTCGTSAKLEELFGCAGPFWARYYTVHSGGRPMCVIYDVFSPRMFEEADGSV
jgi:chorismate--pyruvate lyase